MPSYFFPFESSLSFSLTPLLCTVITKFVLSWGLGASIHACRIMNRHVIALEEDKAIFDAILAPMIRKVPDVPTSSVVAVMDSDDEDAVEIEVPHIVKKSRFSK